MRDRGIGGGGASALSLGILGKNKLPLSDSLFDITRNYAAAAAAVTARCNAVAADAVAG